MAKLNKTFKDILKVSASNILSLLSGIFVGFLLPKILGITDYGYYKTFTLYASYVGLFHFGFADGIYLKYGGKDFEELDKDRFRLYSAFLLLLEIFISVVGIFISLLFLSGELKFIFICISFYLISANITNYYQLISQITGRFNELSIRNSLLSLFTVLTVLSLWIVHKCINTLVSYKYFIIIYCIIYLLLTCWYAWTYRSLTFGKHLSFKDGKKELVSFFLSGFPLLFANLCSSLILTLDRQFVNVLFDTDTYAVYAFAYNMLGLITTALSAISTVMYPTMKRITKKTLTNNYGKLIEAILFLVFSFLLAYFPLQWFVSWFLPKYVDSLPIFRVILPGLAISSAITIIMHNYYKTDGKEPQFFIKSIIILALSALTNFLAYYFFKTTISISVASIIVMIVWYVMIEEYFIRTYKVKWLKNFTYMILMAAVFYLITCWDCWWAEMLIYLAVFCGLSYLFYWKDINDLAKKGFKKRKKRDNLN